MFLLDVVPPSIDPAEPIVEKLSEMQIATVAAGIAIAIVLVLLILKFKKK